MSRAPFTRLPLAPVASALAAILAFAAPALAAEAASPTPAPISSGDSAAALARAEAYLAERPAESGRKILNARFIPPHGRAGGGFWLIELAPYPPDKPTPAQAFTGLLIALDGKVEERGARRPPTAESPRQNVSGY